ncbi:class I SAM-dependent methyltransferase [Mycobacterium sp. smrl_JER01]|uniref:class I SAM-dependent methyltransferase n=1 Tax=Mycobacterium sp. smrl_JER01 TaxID=3402633 RepID=UPI003AD1BC2C
MSAVVSEQLIDELIDAWERQQSAYVRNRSQRFDVILDTTAYARPDLTTVLDIGAGLGSFSKLILQRFPEVNVIALDYDPALLELARHNLRDYSDRLSVIEADLRDPSWPDALGIAKPDIVVSSTALHWLPTPDLIRLYQTLATVLDTRGLFFNADHLSHPVGAVLHAVSTRDDHEHQQAAFGQGVADWDGWWNTLRGLAGFAELVAERDRRFGDAPENLDTTAALHTEALRVAGFTETGTLWQYLDDYVVYGVK